MCGCRPVQMTPLPDVSFSFGLQPESYVCKSHPGPHAVHMTHLRCHSVCVWLQPSADDRLAKVSFDLWLLPGYYFANCTVVPIRCTRHLCQRWHSACGCRQGDIVATALWPRTMQMTPLPKVSFGVWLQPDADDTLGQGVIRLLAAPKVTRVQ